MFPRKNIVLLAVAFSLAMPSAVIAAESHGAGTEVSSGFYNPVIWADVPDPDVIRVGDDFYMVSTTMHLMPGCPVMRSRDLVNWTTVGYVFDSLNDTPRYSLEGGTVYGKGQWATSIRYRDGRFYVLFSPNDEPYQSYIYTTEDPSGHWDLLCRTEHFHDSSLLLDDDGRAFVFSGGGNIRLTELNPDLTGVLPGGVDKVVIRPDSTETGLHEGSRVIKHAGKYYAFVISWPAGKPRRQLCYRADNIEGPYEKCVVLESEFGGFPYVGQGCIVDDTDGNWWGMIFQDRGGVGRVLTLNPCEWKDGWPMLGDADGKVPSRVDKTICHVPGSGVCASDEFEDGKMSVLWQWNHNPDPAGWSLTETPGRLRLVNTKTSSNLFEARNTVSQRMEGAYGDASVKINVADMKNGDIAGFAAFNGDTGLVSVEAGEGRKWIVARATSVSLGGKSHEITGVEDREMERLEFNGEEIWFRITTDFTPGRDIAEFYYSLDGEDWHRVGQPFKMIFDYRRFFMGTRYALFNYATLTPGGAISIDWFRVKTSRDSGGMSAYMTENI